MVEFDPKDFIDEICEWLESGKFLSQYCKQPGKPSRATVLNWRHKFEDIDQRIARAREAGADALFEDCQEIIDEVPPVDVNGKTDAGWVAWQKNRVWARQQMATKINPRQYGEKMSVDIKDTTNISERLQRGRERLNGQDSED